MKKAYRDGYEVGTRRGGDPEVIKKAIDDCRSMGWNYLLSYFTGQLDALIERKNEQSPKATE